MTKELLLARIQDLIKQREQYINNANGCLGAIQDCEYWLAQLENPAQSSNATPPASTAAEATN